MVTWIYERVCQNRQVVGEWGTLRKISNFRADWRLRNLEPRKPFRRWLLHQAYIDWLDKCLLNPSLGVGNRYICENSRICFCSYGTVSSITLKIYEGKEQRRWRWRNFLRKPRQTWRRISHVGRGSGSMMSGLDEWLGIDSRKGKSGKGTLFWGRGR